MNTVPAEPCEYVVLPLSIITHTPTLKHNRYYTIKFTMRKGDTYTFRSNDRTDIRRWEQAIVMARALSEGILLPALGYDEAASNTSTPDILRSSSVESRGDVHVHREKDKEEEEEE